MNLVRFSIDSGLVVLIWMVQLIIYPSFKYYSKTSLLLWHAVYVKRISIIVIPLMVAQVVIIGWQLYAVQNLYTTTSAILVLAVWGSTFVTFVPRHNSIAENNYTDQTIAQLVSYNWIRTFIWSMIWFLTFICG